MSVCCTLFSFGDFSSHVFFWSVNCIERLLKHAIDTMMIIAKILCLSFISLIFNLSSSFCVCFNGGWLHKNLLMMSILYGVVNKIHKIKLCEESIAINFSYFSHNQPLNTRVPPLFYLIYPNHIFILLQTIFSPNLILKIFLLI